MQDAFLAGVACARRSRGSRARSAAGCCASRATAPSTRVARRRTLRPVDTETMAMIERTQAEDRVEEVDEPARLAGDAELVALVWESVDALGQRDAEVLDLSLRHGLTPAEVAEVVGTNRNAANQMVHRARVRLGDADPRPCAVARRRAAVWRPRRRAPRRARDALRRRRGARHHRARRDCERCQERRRLRLDPAALFAAVPIVTAPTLLKAKVAHALADEGVPMGRAAAADGIRAADAARRGAPDAPDRRGWCAAVVAVVWSVSSSPPSRSTTIPHLTPGSRTCACRPRPPRPLDHGRERFDHGPAHSAPTSPAVAPSTSPPPTRPRSPQHRSRPRRPRHRRAGHALGRTVERADDLPAPGGAGADVVDHGARGVGRGVGQRIHLGRRRRVVTGVPDRFRSGVELVRELTGAASRTPSPHAPPSGTVAGHCVGDA